MLCLSSIPTTHETLTIKFKCARNHINLIATLYNQILHQEKYQSLSTNDVLEINQNQSKKQKKTVQKYKSHD